MECDGKHMVHHSSRFTACLFPPNLGGNNISLQSTTSYEYGIDGYRRIVVTTTQDLSCPPKLTSKRTDMLPGARGDSDAPNNKIVHRKGVTSSVQRIPSSVCSIIMDLNVSVGNENARVQLAFDIII
ncbi:hypothetical protein TNCV_829221 [Trichonephila clavipes]|nr:hypothetical protein TNCV_829221 [Trichonephila clavipes]